ncbi:uncharacterized protein LOC120674685 [Panicum virgatum]|uniref:uncharacterized protein LOC120674685 n=1 Tax=Panicum virgatum TaxID=38727 RepID=UPI0019D51EEF|nr:uncharacterized protein LOC120674685 [Panicum virgatum]
MPFFGLVTRFSSKFLKYRGYCRESCRCARKGGLRGAGEYFPDFIGKCHAAREAKACIQAAGEVLEEGSSQPPDNAELNALRERVKTLSSEKAFQEKIKKLSKAKKDEIEKLKKIKTDSDREVATCLQQLKTLSESRDLMQQELEELRDAAQDVAGLVEIPEGNEKETAYAGGEASEST